MLGTRGEGAARAALVGSVSLTTIVTAVCPVVVVPPGSGGLGVSLPNARSILCGIGASRDNAPLRVAFRLARAFHLSLLPAHVVEHADEVARGDASARTDELLADVLTDVLSPSRRGHPSASVHHGSSMLSSVQDPDIRAGDPVEQLTQLGAESHAALVVVGAHGRGPVRSALLGSVSRSLACRSLVPVVICPRATAD